MTTDTFSSYNKTSAEALVSAKTAPLSISLVENSSLTDRSPTDSSSTDSSLTDRSPTDSSSTEIFPIDIHSSVKKLHIVYIVPSRYDDDGYVQRWIKGVVPSNTLACMKSLTRDMIAKKPFGDVQVSLESFDDCIEDIPISKLSRMNRRAETQVVVGLVGIQSGMFPRAMAIAAKLRSENIPVLMGGFHVSGILSLFDELTPELQKMLDIGVTLVQGECETPGVLDHLFADVINQELKPIYRFPAAPEIEHASIPVGEPEYVHRFAAPWATLDTSRGCPFDCSFCTVINIQGRKMRCRSAEIVLEAVDKNCANGITSFFFTDDNFARSKYWREIFAGLKERRQKGQAISFMMQVDTQSYKIPGFIESAKDAGCRMAFIGMESVNPENIAAVGKSQNSVAEYRPMVLKWQEAGILVHVGYIIGFPCDTLESVKQDVAFLRDHVQVDEASFFMLTPLPGSVDHREMLKNHIWLDPDLNKYDSYHEAFHHQRMKNGEWKKAATIAYDEFYSKENIVRILRRTTKDKYWYMFWNCIWYRYSGVYSGIHPMSTGFGRKKPRKERRPEFPQENIFKYSWRRIKDYCQEVGRYVRLFYEFQEIWLLTRKQQKAAIEMPDLENVLNTPVFAEVFDPPKANESKKNAFLRTGEQLAAWSWTLLSDVRARWNVVQERVASCSWAGHWDEGIRELKAVLFSIQERLTEINRTLTKYNRGKKNRKKISKLVSAIDREIAKVEASEPNQTTLQSIQAFIGNQLIAQYDEFSDRYLRLRRRVDNWRQDTVRYLKSGRCLSPKFVKNLITAPYMTLLDVLMSLRFGWAAVRHE